MQKFVVRKKTGFEIKDPIKPVIIRDNRGILFYSTESRVPKTTCFNLPPFGNYFLETGEQYSGISVLPKPIEYKLAKLPPTQPRFESPFDFPIKFGVNKNKCTIKWGEQIIFFDNAFKEKPLPQVFFILYHEYAHAFYQSETLCDQMAGNYMKVRGFNPSQIGEAPILALSERQEQRKQNMVESLIEC